MGTGLGAARDNGPVVGLDIVQRQCLTDLIVCQGARKILLIGKHQQRGTGQALQGREDKEVGSI